MNNQRIEDLIKGIKGWLGTKGYPLEMLTARSFLGSSFGVRQGWHYDDPETGTSREQDVLATAQISERNILLFQIIVECKKSVQPFVAFTYGPDLSKGMSQSWVPTNPLGRSFLNELSSNGSLEQLPIYRPTSPVAYSVIQAPIEKEPKKKSGIDPAYEAMMTVTKASYSLAQLYATKVRTISSGADSPEQRPVAYIGFPLIVVDAPIFECYLDEKNEPAVNHLHELVVEWSYPPVGTLMLRMVSINVLDHLVENVRQSIATIDRESRPILSSLQPPTFIP